MNLKISLKNKLKRIFILGLAAGVTFNSIPLSAYASTIYQSEATTETEPITEDGATLEGESTTESETTEETEQTTESTIPDETEKESESEVETETEAETETEGETETEAETENETETEIETETETELEIETETEVDLEAEFQEKLALLEEEAKKSLTELLQSEYVMALVYLCDSYAVKAEPDFSSASVEKLGSGYTVFITDTAVDTDNKKIWYKITFSVNGEENTGYIEREYLAYSNENFLAWEEEYLEPIEKLLSESGVPMSIYNDTAPVLNGYSSDIAQFPPSYQTALQALKNSHPNWTFVAFNTGLNWNEVVSNEMVGSRSLIYYTAKDSFKKQQYDSKWYYASQEAVEYYLDPRNSLTESAVFQFEQLTFNSSYHNVSAIQSLLNGTFMKGTVPKASVSYAQAFYDIGKSRGISPFHLASRVVQEQGINGTSPLISGTYSGYEGYYNYFNIGATSANPIPTGLARAKQEGWNTPYKSLEGGAKFIGNGYILQGQDTLYLQKFDVESQYNGLYWHQYMQNIQAPTTEASTTRSQYNQSGSLNSTFVFKIPVYIDMPKEEIMLSTNNISLKGGYETTIEYTIADKKSTLNKPLSSNTNVAIVEKVQNSEKTNDNNNTVTGTVKVTALSPGTTTISFVATNGATATCKVTVVADNITIKLDPPPEKELKAGLSDGSCEGTYIDLNYTIDNPKSRLTSCTSGEVNSAGKNLLKITKQSEAVKDNVVEGTIRLTGLNPGTAKAVLKSTYAGSATYTVTIIRLPEAIEFTEEPQNAISVGNSMVLHAEVLPEDTTNKNFTWKSSDESIAIVNAETGRVTGISSGTVTLTATAEEKSLKGKTVSLSRTITVVPAVKEVKIAANKAELLEGETFALNGEIIPKETADYVLAGEMKQFYTLTYQSSDEEIAVVDEHGVITAKGLGNAVITATVTDRTTPSNTKTATCLVSVVMKEEAEPEIPEYSHVQPEKIDVYNNETAQPMTEASYTLITGNELTLGYQVLPENADLESVRWESSKPSIIRVEEKEDGTATILAGTKGNATVTVSTDNGIQKTLCFTVEEKYTVEQVSLDKEAVILYVNGSNEEEEQKEGGFYADVQLNVTPKDTPENGIEYQWRSSKESVAVVDENGKVTAKGVGTAVITVQDKGGSGKYAQCTVTVKSCIEKLETDYSALSLQPDKQITISSVIFPAEATDKNLVWESSDETVATVSPKGVVKVLKTAQAGSTADITLTDTVTGISKTMPLTVAETACYSVSLYAMEGENVDNSVKLSAKTLYQNGSDAEQTFLIAAEGLAKDKSQLEGLSFYAISSNAKVAEVSKTSGMDGIEDNTFQVKAIGKGTANITIYAADGSGKSATVRVTVNVYPEEAQVQKQEVYLTKGASETLKVTVNPVASNDKSVIWKFKDDIPVEGFQITSAGKVTVAKTAQAGDFAEFVAVTKTGRIVSDTCTVRVVSKKVTSLKLDKTSLIMTGLGTAKLTPTIAPADADVRELSFTSSDETVAVVNEEGLITAQGFGTAVITVQTLDGSKKAQCKLTVAPIDKAYSLCAVQASHQIQKYALDVDSRCCLQIRNQFGSILDNSLFTFTSSDSSIAQVDENGIVTPNPAYNQEKNGKVTITAALTDDPYNRKVKFTVTILAKEQAESISVMAEVSQGGSTLVNPESMQVTYPVSDNTITFTAEALNVYGNKLDTKLNWAVSDTSMATIKPDKDMGTAVLTVKKAGSFYITCTADDTWKKSRKIRITSVDTRPILKQSKLSVSRYRETEQGAGGIVCVKTDSFSLAAAKGFPIQSVTVTDLAKGKTTVDSTGILVETDTNGNAAVWIPDTTLQLMENGTYKANLAVKVKGETTPGQETTLDYVFPVTISVGNTQPKVTVRATDINVQNITKLQSSLVITAPAEVESVELVQGQSNRFDTRFEVKQQAGSFSLNFIDREGYRAKSITGKLIVKLKGYQPVTVSVTVKTPDTKDVIEPSRTVVLDNGSNKSSQIVSLYDKTTKEIISNYKLTVPEDAKLGVTKNSDGDLVIRPNDKTPVKNGASVLVTVQVMALSDTGTPLWAVPVNVRLSAKIYTVAPKVTLGTPTLTLNRQIAGEVVETTIKTDRSNVEIAQAHEWLVKRYDTKTKKYIECKEDEPVKFSYDKKGILRATMTGILAKGTYKYQISQIAEDYPNVTVNLNVSVIDAKASVKITTKGSLDLLKRADSTLQGKVVLTNTKGAIRSITLLETDENGNLVKDEQGNCVKNSSFYSTWIEDNTFRIRLLQSASMTTGKKVLPVKIVLEGGTVWYTSVTFQIGQSTPTVSTPKTQTLYKSEENPTVVYDMNTQIPKGYRISAIEKTAVPEGIGVTVKDGRVTATLTDLSMKPGTYSIKVKLYFKGAQQILGSTQGKAVEKTLKVVVK